VTGVADILLVAGMSGAGRSQAADDLEDLGWFVVDNMPTELVDKVVELAAGGSAGSRLGLVVSTVAAQREVSGIATRLRNGGHRVRLLYLDAATAELVRRYGATRRRHPLDDGAGGVAAAIDRERVLLEPVKEAADLVIDTTSLTVHQLKARLADHFAPDEVGEAAMQVSVVSFGYKQGIPLDVDLVFDVRFLPNPHWDEALRPKTGLDDEVRAFVASHEVTGAFMERLGAMLDLLLPAYRAEGKSYLTIAVGCTGGRHRSVAIAEDLARWLRDRGVRPRVTHRDVTLG
jgi:UPF0042 nucleotide-binding protein